MKPEEQKLFSEKFKEINEAYKVLSNQDSRYKYDQFLGISSEHSLREDSLYAKILREKEEKEISIKDCMRTFFCAGTKMDSEVQ